MKTLLSACLLVPSLVMAMPQQTQPQAATFQTICVNAEDLTKTVAEFQELPYVRGISSPLSQEGARLSLVVFLNPKTGSFTIVERTQDGLYCILAVGNNFEPVPREIHDEVRSEQEKGRL